MIELDPVPCGDCGGAYACHPDCPSAAAHHAEQVALDLDNPPDLAPGERAPDHWTPAMKETGR